MSSTRIHGPIRSYYHALTESKLRTSDVPFGCYKYDSGTSNLPGGLFHFVKDCDLYVPTLHGLTSEFIRTHLKEVAVCAVTSSIVNRPFLNSPHLYEVELINTGCRSLRQGDRFTVQLPNEQDIKAQEGVTGELGYNTTVNKGIWGGLLATRRVNCEFGGDPVEEVINAIRQDPGYNAFELISPYTPESTLSMLTLIANAGNYGTIPQAARNLAAAAINEDLNLDRIIGILEDPAAKTFLRKVLRLSMCIMEGVQGFAGGQVLRSCNGYNYNTVHTGDRFIAQLNMHRWLS